jgi:hypothetical protein
MKHALEGSYAYSATKYLSEVTRNSHQILRTLACFQQNFLTKNIHM